MPRSVVRRVRRGFALPVVLAMTLIIGASVAIILQQDALRARSVARQLDSYQEHHGTRGLEEVLDAWVGTLNNQPVQDYVVGDGHVLDVTLGDGSVAKVYMSDGQAEALAGFGQLRGDDRLYGPAIIDELALRVGEDDLAAFTRADGPVAVNANTADIRVLEAVAASVVDDDDLASRLAREIVSARDEQELTTATLGRIWRDAEVEATLRVVLGRLLVERSGLWRLRIDVLAPRSAVATQQVLSSYEGLVQLSGSGGVGRGAGGILSFEPVPIR